MTKRDVLQGDEPDAAMFRNYSIALKMWARKFNTYETCLSGLNILPLEVDQS